MKYLFVAASLFAFVACRQQDNEQFAAGNFETDEILVAAEQGGRILELSIHEGDRLPADTIVGRIDMGNTAIQREQVEASIKALSQKTNDPQPQLELVRRQLRVQESQLEQAQREEKRIERLVAADAATRKQLDDSRSVREQLENQMAVTRQQLQFYQSTINTQNRSILSEAPALEKRAAALADQVSRGAIRNPISGTVLTQYAYAGEVTAPGKPLYSIANLDTLTLRAYVTGTQLPAIRLGQAVTVRIDQGKNGHKEYSGRLSWIADKSEFTPKTIQTKEERANLVYAVKIKVPNDGFLKIGMYGEMLLP